ncbi:MAG: imidazoleglycerol-phosphate dehydratase HisB [Fibrobacteria bacterium]|nr:imidazoleglycerol-phosphate dehydratase HisB [Fibrobacteria bacterium]
MNRTATIKRKTNETDITLKLDLDKSIKKHINTGSAFLDHMLDLFSTHGGIGLSVECKGDVDVDMHHSSEDIAICLGEALLKAVGNKKGIERFGHYYVPMDEALVRTVLDLSGRISFVFKGKLKNNIVGNLETEMIIHFFQSFAQAAKINLHIDIIRGSNTHHCIEGIFKSFARALSMAISSSTRVRGIPSTKGML